jgi:hypothetical protein
MCYNKYIHITKIWSYSWRKITIVTTTKVIVLHSEANIKLKTGMIIKQIINLCVS